MKIEESNQTKIHIIGAIVLAAMVMLLTLFFFIPYITEQATIETMTQNVKNSVKQIKLTQEYYMDAVLQEIQADKNTTLSFCENHKGLNGKLPPPTTIMHDLSNIFSKNTEITYHFYREDPFKNHTSSVLSSSQKEAIDFLKKNPKEVYIKRDILNGKEVLRIATIDFMPTKSSLSYGNSSHSNKTREQDSWKLGDKRGIIEVITPIASALAQNEKVRNYILLLLFCISSIVLFLLSKLLLNNEKSLKNEIDTKLYELETLSSLINNKMISSKINLEGKMTYVSAPLLKVSKYTKEELVGESYSILRHPKGNKEVYNQLWETLKAGKSWSGDLLKRAKDGSSFYLHTTVVPIFDKNNKILEFTSFSEDISEKVKIQNHLEYEKTFKETIFNNQDEIIFISSFKEGVIKINHRFFHIFNYIDFNDFKKQHRSVCELFITKKGYLKCAKPNNYWTDKLLLHPKAIHKALMLDKHNEERIFRVRIKEIKVADEKYHIVTFSNITELEKARELAESSEKAKAMFMANMSHELRTPLNGIHGFVSLLANTKLDEKQHKYVSLINTSSSNLIGIVNDILDFSKIESGKMTLSSIEINPFVDFRNILELFTIKCHEKEIEYRTYIDENIPLKLMIDKLRITQILSNLIGNAIKFTPNNGSIIVDIKLLKRDEQFTELGFSIKDSGVGIPKERQESIFEAFSQADDSITRKFGGTGLGLSISLSLIKLMHGSLFLESIPNKGSTFSFTIKTETIIQKSFNILVLEENEMNQIIMDELFKLSTQETKVTFVSTEKRLEAHLSNASYDLIFIDLLTYKHSEISSNLKRLTKGVPIVTLTTHSPSLIEKNLLSKPIKYQLFNKLLEMHLRC